MSHMPRAELASNMLKNGMSASEILEGVRLSHQEYLSLFDVARRSADLSADLVRAALEAAVTKAKEFSEQIDGEEFDGGMWWAADKIAHRLEELSDNPEAIDAIVAQVMEGQTQINWANDPDAIVEDDEPQIGRDYA